MATLTTSVPPTAADPDSRRVHLRTVTVAWVFGSFWATAASGAALTKFQLALHTPDWAFGILAALPYAAGLAQLPASVLLAQGRSRKQLFLTWATAGRLLWVAVALVPWVLPQGSRWGWPSAIALLALAWTAENVGAPAWTDWMADVIPRRLRGRFFANRKRIGLAAGAAASLVIGYALSRVAAPTPSPADAPGVPAAEVRVSPDGRDPLLVVTSLILAGAGLLGALDILSFRRIPDAHPVSLPARGPALRAVIGEPLRDANFRRFLAFNFIFNIAVGYIGTYVWLYGFKVIGFSDLQANLVFVAVPAVVFGSVYGPWGRLIDRFGKKPVLVIAGSIMINGAWGWILIGRGSLPLTVIGYSVALSGMLCWPGVEIANFNMLLGMTGSTAGAARRNGAAYAALYGVAVAAGGMVSGAIGSTIAKSLEHLAWPIPGLGITLTYHGVLFLLSTLMRILAIALAIRLVEPRATGTRDALRAVTTNLYSNAREVVLLPTRMAGRAYRMTYRLNPAGTRKRDRGL